jgi:hypothetical protein
VAAAEHQLFEPSKGVLNVRLSTQSGGMADIVAPGPVAIIPFLDRRFQPQLDQPEHVPVHDATGY